MDEVIEAAQNEMRGSDLVKFIAGQIAGQALAGWDVVTDVGSTIGHTALYLDARHKTAYYREKAELHFSQGNICKFNENMDLWQAAFDKAQEYEANFVNKVEGVGAVVENVYDFAKLNFDLIYASATGDEDGAMDAAVEIANTVITMDIVVGRIIEILAEEYENADYFEKGVMHGRVKGTVKIAVLSLVAGGGIANVARLKRIEMLNRFKEKLGKTGIPKNLKSGWGKALTRINKFIAGLISTKMCFVAGTLVLASIDGEAEMIPIEQLTNYSSVHPRELEVWSKNDITGEGGVEVTSCLF